MRLAKSVFLLTLTMLMMSLIISAQTRRSEEDPRNTAPTVGTGGSVGGPTGLFTVYDGQTLRRGEYTFSIAYSNYDRDPGNVDITEIPVSFQIGVNDHLELFYGTDAYRGVKVNNPQNLSSFYLPNTTHFVGVFPFRSAPAIILPPERVSRSGAPTGSEQGNFGAAANFPGVGSPFGSILPGIVLTTRTIPANLTFNTLTVPDLFTIAPAYLPDAPFINRLYGESAFSTFPAGGEWRLAGAN